MRSGVRLSATHMLLVAGSTLLSALHKAKLDVPLAALDIIVATLVRGELRSSLTAGVLLGGAGGRLRLQT